MHWESFSKQRLKFNPRLSDNKIVVAINELTFSFQLEGSRKMSQLEEMNAQNTLFLTVYTSPLTTTPPSQLFTIILMINLFFS